MSKRILSLALAASMMFPPQLAFAQRGQGRDGQGPNEGQRREEPQRQEQRREQPRPQMQRMERAPQQQRQEYRPAPQQQQQRREQPRPQMQRMERGPDQRPQRQPGQQGPQPGERRASPQERRERNVGPQQQSRPQGQTPFRQNQRPDRGPRFDGQGPHREDNRGPRNPQGQQFRDGRGPHERDYRGNRGPEHVQGRDFHGRPPVQEWHGRPSYDHRPTYGRPGRRLPPRGGYWYVPPPRYPHRHWLRDDWFVGIVVVDPFLWLRPRWVVVADYYTYDDPFWPYHNVPIYVYRDPVIVVPQTTVVDQAEQPQPVPAAAQTIQENKLYVYARDRILRNLEQYKKIDPHFVYQVSVEKDRIHIDTNLPAWSGDEKDPDSFYIDVSYDEKGDIDVVSQGDWVTYHEKDENDNDVSVYRREYAVGPLNVLGTVEHKYLPRLKQIRFAPAPQPKGVSSSSLLPGKGSLVLDMKKKNELPVLALK